MAKENSREKKMMEVLQKAYTKERAEDANALHNAIVEVVHEHKAAVYDTLFVLDLIRFELMQAKYREIMGVVKLTETPPLKRPKKEKPKEDKQIDED